MHKRTNKPRINPFGLPIEHGEGVRERVRIGVYMHKTGHSGPGGRGVITLAAMPDQLTHVNEILDRLKQLAVAPDYWGGEVREEMLALTAELDALLEPES